MTERYAKLARQQHRQDRKYCAEIWKLTEVNNADNANAC
jgi:hypothetical protein